MKLQGKQIGILVALILGVIMMFLPGQDKNKYSFSPSLLAEEITEGTDQISPQTLSEWIIEGRNDYQLIDIRTAEEFEKGSIKGAQNIVLNDLLQKQTIENDLYKDKYIVLFSNGNSHAHQAWLVLKSAGLDCFTLEGGLNFWNKQILNPQLASQEPSDDEVLKYKAAKAVSAYFGGGGESTVNLKKSVKKTTSKKPIRGKKKKKKLGGC